MPDVLMGLLMLGLVVAAAVLLAWSLGRPTLDAVSRWRCRRRNRNRNRNRGRL